MSSWIRRRECIRRREMVTTSHLACKRRTYRRAAGRLRFQLARSCFTARADHRVQGAGLQFAIERGRYTEIAPRLDHYRDAPHSKLCLLASVYFFFCAAARASAMACLKPAASSTPGTLNVPIMKAGVPWKPNAWACSLLRANSATIAGL